MYISPLPTFTLYLFPSPHVYPTNNQHSPHIYFTLILLGGGTPFILEDCIREGGWLKFFGIFLGSMLDIRYV